MIKLIAFATMTLDHLRVIGYDDFILVGRLAYPLFAYMLAYNYVCRTRDQERYISRLAILAAVSFVPYHLAFPYSENLNIIFTLMIGIILFYAYERYPRIISFVFVFVIVMTLYTYFIYVYFPVGYGFAGISLIFVFAWILKYEQSILYSVPFLMLLNGYDYFLFYMIFSLMSLVVIYFAERYKIDFGFMKSRLWYGFYPGHLLILYLIA